MDKDELNEKLIEELKMNTYNTPHMIHTFLGKDVNYWYECEEKAKKYDKLVKDIQKFEFPKIG